MCTIKGVEKQHFAKLDPKKKKLSILAKESSLIPSQTLELVRATPQCVGHEKNLLSRGLGFFVLLFFFFFFCFF